MLLLTAGGQGLEPRFLGPKPSVLPLDDPPAVSTNNTKLKEHLSILERTPKASLAYH